MSWVMVLSPGMVLVISVAKLLALVLALVSVLALPLALATMVLVLLLEEAPPLLFAPLPAAALPVSPRFLAPLSFREAGFGQSSGSFRYREREKFSLSENLFVVENER